MAIQEIYLRTKQICPGDVIIRFKNDFAGWDVVHFPGNGKVEFNSQIQETSRVRVEDFSTGGATGNNRVDRIRSGEQLQVSRFFGAKEKEGLQQMLSSRLVQIYTGEIPAPEIQTQGIKWLDVSLQLNTWSERRKENLIFISLSINLPERFTDEQ